MSTVTFQHRRYRSPERLIVQSEYSRRRSKSTGPVSTCSSRRRQLREVVHYEAEFPACTNQGVDTNNRFTIGAASGLELTDASDAVLKFSNINKSFTIPTVEPVIKYGATELTHRTGQVGAIDVFSARSFPRDVTLRRLIRLLPRGPLTRPI